MEVKKEKTNQPRYLGNKPVMEGAIQRRIPPVRAATVLVLRSFSEVGMERVMGSLRGRSRSNLNPFITHNDSFGREAKIYSPPFGGKS
ncbi:MAG TPA: hypothetical protein DDX75_09365 [Phycisphaerales bacterium]|nr:hypothetical protein [Phycisphaerales bacterium]